MTALMWACRRGNDAIIPLLIAVGDDTQLQASDKRGQTALMHAAASGHVNAAEILVVDGSDLLDRREDGMTALMLAAQAGVRELVPVLTSETFESHENRTRHPEAQVLGPRSPRSSALSAQRPAQRSAQQVAQQVGQRSGQRSSKDSLPMKAARPAGPTEGEARDVGLRRIHRAEVLNAQDAEGRTALMHAAQCLHAPTIRVLLDAGADRNLVDAQGRTAQMLAHSARSVGKSRAKAHSLREFRNVSAATISNPPLIAARKEHVGVGKEDMHGVGAFVLDVGTGSCKLMLWMRFSSVALHELIEIKQLDFKSMFEHCKQEPDPKADPRFCALVGKLHATMEEAFATQRLIQQCLITNLCVGVTAWYRQMKPELRELGVAVLDALRDELELKARALADSAHDEHMMSTDEHMMSTDEHMMST